MHAVNPAGEASLHPHFHRVRFAGRAALHLPCHIVGNGMLFSTRLLAVQPWTAFATAVKHGATAGKVAGTVVARRHVTAVAVPTRYGLLESCPPPVSSTG